MTAERRLSHIKEAGGALIVVSVVVSVLAATVAFGASADELSTPHKWADALAEARSVQQLMAYAIVALSVALAGLGGYLIRLLSGIIRENTAELRSCRERHERK